MEQDESEGEEEKEKYDAEELDDKPMYIFGKILYITGISEF